MPLGVYDEGSVLSYLYFGVKEGIFPPLIFLGIGAMTDFSTMLSNPKLVLLGAAAQVGIFLTFLGALALGFSAQEAGAIGIIGGADGPTAIFLSAKLAPHLLGSIAIAAYSYMALVPVIQPPIMRLLTTESERRIHMKAPKPVPQRVRIIFPIAAFLICAMIAPGSMVLLGMLFFGNLLKESGVTDRLANSARNAMIDIVTILLGFSVGASTQAVRMVEVDGVMVNQGFLSGDSLLIFGLGALSTLDQHRFGHVCHNRLGFGRPTQKAEGDIARAAGHIQKPLPVARCKPIHHGIFPKPMNADRHDIVHQVVFRGHG